MTNFTITRGTRSWGVTVHIGTPHPYRVLVKTTDGPAEHKFKSFEAMMELLVDPENSRVYEQLRSK